MNNIQQLIPDTKDTLVFLGEPGAKGIPIKVRFFALYPDGTISAFIIDPKTNSLVPAESRGDFLYIC